MSELQTMQDALDIVKDIQIGDLVQGEVLTLQDKQATRRNYRWRC